MLLKNYFSCLNDHTGAFVQGLDNKAIRQKALSLASAWEFSKSSPALDLLNVCLISSVFFLLSCLVAGGISLQNKGRDVCCCSALAADSWGQSPWQRPTPP